MSEGYNNKKLEQSEGVDHARRAIANARDTYFGALYQYNTSGKNGNRILIPFRQGEQNQHVVVYEAFDIWRTLVAEEYRDDDIAVHWGQVLDTIQIPKTSVSGDGVAEIDLYEKERMEYGVPQDPNDYSVSIADLETVDFDVGIGNMTWFDDKYLEVRVLGRQGFDGRETAVRQFRLVPPMYVLKQAGRKLNSVYARLGEGIQPKRSQPHGKT